MGRRTKRANQDRDIVTDFELGEFGRRLANRLENEGDRTFFSIGVSNSERNAFTVVLVRLEDDKLSCLTFLRDQRGVDAELEYRGR